MKVIKKVTGNYDIQDKFGNECLNDWFPTIEALENHVKLMLIAVQRYREDSKVELYNNKGTLQEYFYEEDHSYENISKD